MRCPRATNPRLSSTLWCVRVGGVGGMFGKGRGCVWQGCSVGACRTRRMHLGNSDSAKPDLAHCPTPIPVYALVIRSVLTCTKQSTSSCPSIFSAIPNNPFQWIFLAPAHHHAHAQVENQALELLVQNLSRLDETSDEDAQVRCQSSVPGWRFGGWGLRWCFRSAWYMRAQGE